MAPMLACTLHWVMNNEISQLTSLLILISSLQILSWGNISVMKYVHLEAHYITNANKSSPFMFSRIQINISFVFYTLSHVRTTSVQLPKGDHFGKNDLDFAIVTKHLLKWIWNICSHLVIRVASYNDRWSSSLINYKL